jgi:hypothetical protein
MPVVPTGDKSVFEVKKRQRKERTRDLKHSLRQDWKIGVIASQVRHMEPGRFRGKAIEEFWISVYHGSQYYDPDYLRMKGWDLAEYLDVLDEIHAEDSSCSFQVITPARMNFWRQWKHRISVVSAIGGLEPL